MKGYINFSTENWHIFKQIKIKTFSSAYALNDLFVYVAEIIRSRLIKFFIVGKSLLQILVPSDHIRMLFEIKPN